MARSRARALTISYRQAMSKTKADLLAHLENEVYCRLGISPVHGIGVFAIRAIPKGTNPLHSRVKYKEIKFTHAEIKKLPRGVRKEIEIFCYYDDKEVLVPEIGMNSMNMAIYLNHSKEPNVRYRKNGQLKTLRGIQAGEELFLDYDQSYGEKHTFK
jgi:SET domain-containing protein